MNHRRLLHKADQPDVVANFFDADGLNGEDRAEIDLFVSQTNPTTIGDHDSLVVEGLVDVTVRCRSAGTDGRPPLDIRELRVLCFASRTRRSTLGTIAVRDYPRLPRGRKYAFGAEELGTARRIMPTVESRKCVQSCL